MRVVLDTCVLVAGMYSSRGASFRLLELLPERCYTPLVSVPVFLEYEEVLKRPGNLRRFGLERRDIDHLLVAVAHFAEPIEVHSRWRPHSPDPEDDRFVDCAAVGRADAVVTFNERDFAGAGRRLGFLVLPPGRLLQRLERAPSGGSP